MPITMHFSAKSMENSGPDPFGLALWDHGLGQFVPPLLLHSIWGEPDELPVDGYFFDADEISEMECHALSLCRGKVLDIGAAAGRHSLVLQNRGLDVVAMDTSDWCCRLMHRRGVRNIHCADIFDFNEEPVYDTLLLMMNGIGLAGDLKGLRRLLRIMHQLLLPGGQVVFDSSDIAYLYDNFDKPKKRYYGEMDYRYEYRGRLGDWFGWIYIDPQKMAAIARDHGWAFQILYSDAYGSYLARLLRI